jgi:H+-transporting ATPase
MKTVLGVATTLGVFGVISSFGLLYMGENVFHLSQSTIQTLMYLKLSVAGHLTVFVARTRGPFWSIKPSRILLFAVIGTQIIATIIAVYGILMEPLGWKYAAIVWGYALSWLIINDGVKLLAYRIFGEEHSGLFGRHVR